MVIFQIFLRRFGCDCFSRVFGVFHYICQYSTLYAMFCSNCGHKLSSTDRFCAQCGSHVGSITGASLSSEKTESSSAKQSSTANDDSSLVFTSKLLLGGNVVRPDRLIIEQNSVVYEKRNKHLIGVDRTLIPISRIASVEIDRGIIRSKIIIYSKGSQAITLENFTISDGKKIKEEIEKRMS
jgi:hypothetical protein